MTAVKNNYHALLKDVKERIRAAQYEALRAVNKELVSLYWDIGRLIAKRQQGVTWGRAVVRKLAIDLQSGFPGMAGFSERNIWYMRKFYLQYHDSPKLQPLVAEINWSHHIIILNKCKSDEERIFYMNQIRRFGWSKNVLIHQIEVFAYKKSLTVQSNYPVHLSQDLMPHLDGTLKDEYTFDFLELADSYNEKQLEFAILAKVEPFLREMGGMFSFIGSQFHLEVGQKEFFIDLLLYHRHLRCLVAIELKVAEFVPEYVGKMQFYLAALDSHVRAKGENPSIGIILCKSKDRTIVEYALRESKKPIGVATYRIVRKLPKNLRHELPGPEKVEKLLSGISEFKQGEKAL